MKISRRRFDLIVKQAIARIPEEFRAHLDNMIITVQARPAPELLEEMGYDPDEALLGIYTGVPLTERSAIEPPLYPDAIYLFQDRCRRFARPSMNSKRRSKSPWCTRWPTTSAWTRTAWRIWATHRG